jgi:phage-related protein
MVWDRAYLKLRYRLESDAFRMVYVVGLGEELWVVHAFQKKSTRDFKTPKREIDLIISRMKN